MPRQRVAGECLQLNLFPSSPTNHLIWAWVAVTKKSSTWIPIIMRVPECSRTYMHRSAEVRSKPICAWSKTKVNTYCWQLIASDIASHPTVIASDFTSDFASNKSAIISDVASNKPAIASNIASDKSAIASDVPSDKSAIASNIASNKPAITSNITSNKSAIASDVTSDRKSYCQRHTVSLAMSLAIEDIAGDRLGRWQFRWRYRASLATSLAARSMTGNLTMVSPAVAGITTSNPASH